MRQAEREGGCVGGVYESSVGIQSKNQCRVRRAEEATETLKKKTHNVRLWESVLIINLDTKAQM